jgi:hypothetical protein
VEASIPTRADASIHGVGAFIAWAVCGLLWFVVYLTVFSVGGAVLVFAILLTVLLATKAVPSWRSPLWVAFGVWLAWWVLVVAGPARDSSGWMVMAGFLFLLAAAASAPGSLGLPFGAGLTAFAAGFRVEAGTALVWVGIVTATAALLAWLFLGRRSGRRSRIAAAGR